MKNSWKSPRPLFRKPHNLQFSVQFPLESTVTFSTGHDAIFKQCGNSLGQCNTVKGGTHRRVLWDCASGRGELSDILQEQKQANFLPINLAVGAAGGTAGGGCAGEGSS